MTSGLFKATKADLSARNRIFETRLSLRRPKPKKAFDRKT
jgi:hypothetical protein